MDQHPAIRRPWVDQPRPGRRGAARQRHPPLLMVSDAPPLCEPGGPRRPQFYIRPPLHRVGRRVRGLLRGAREALPRCRVPGLERAQPRVLRQDPAGPLRRAGGDRGRRRARGEPDPDRDRRRPLAGRRCLAPVPARGLQRARPEHRGRRQPLPAQGPQRRTRDAAPEQGLPPGEEDRRRAPDLGHRDRAGVGPVRRQAPGEGLGADLQDPLGRKREGDHLPPPDRSRRQGSTSGRTRSAR